MQEFQRQRVDTEKLPMQVLEKWSSPVLSEGFVPFPKKLLRTMHRIFTDPDSAKDLAVLLAIVDFKRPNLSRSPSLGYLAFLAGLESSEFETVLRRLEKRGFVTVLGDKEAIDISIKGFLDVIEGEAK